MIPPPILKTLSLWLAVACAVSILLSIAVSQILLALSLGVLLLSGLPLRWPRISIPLGCFLAWTLVALAFSPDPAYGLSEVRKMLVFAMLLIVFSAVRTAGEAKCLAFGWIGVGTITAGLGIFQYAADVAGARAANSDFYHFYIADRIRGLMSHWMTFSGQELFVLLIAAAFILFAPDVKRRLWIALPCAALVGIALVLSDTRSIWIAAVVAGFYLVCCWDLRGALAAPVLLVIFVLAAPGAIQERARSIVNPQKETDSNGHRVIVWRTGWEMIKAHPLLGVGPEEIRKPEVFFAYMPADIQRPLPSGYYGHLHNIYIHYAAECGVPATLALLAAFALAFADFWRALAKLPPGRSDQRFLLHAAIACLIGTMVAGVFEKNLGDTEVLTMFLAMMSMGYLARADILGNPDFYGLES